MCEWGRPVTRFPSKELWKMERSQVGDEPRMDWGDARVEG